MAATPMTFQALQSQAEDSRLVRKSLKLLGFYAKNDAPVPDLTTGFVDTADRTKLSIDLEVWKPFGILTPDGLERDTSVDQEEAEGYNYADFVRTDIIKAPKSVKVTLLQDKTRLSLEKQYGVDLSGVVSTAGKGFAFDEPTLPVFPYQRLLFIDLDYFDGDQSKPIYGIDLYPRAKQSDLPKVNKKKQGYPELELSFDIFTDNALGTPGRHWVDGTGYDMEQQGFGPSA